MPTIDSKLTSTIKAKLEAYQAERGNVIERSREILQAAKQAIFAMHRQDLEGAAKHLEQAEQIAQSLAKKFSAQEDLAEEGSYRAALEEYVEAKFLHSVLLGETLGAIKTVDLGPGEYLGGLADMTGELVRQAVLRSSSGQYEFAAKYYEVVAEVVAFLGQLYLTGYLRQKFDDAKRNLQRLEQMRYELHVYKNVKG